MTERAFNLLVYVRQNLHIVAIQFPMNKVQKSRLSPDIAT